MKKKKETCEIIVVKAKSLGIAGSITSMDFRYGQWQRFAFLTNRFSNILTEVLHVNELTIKFSGSCVQLVCLTGRCNHRLSGLLRVGAAIVDTCPTGKCP